MKKTKISILVGTMLILSLLGTNVLAVSESNQKSNKEKVIYQKDEIQDLTEIKSRAEMGITDDPQFKSNDVLSNEANNKTSNNQVPNVKKIKNVTSQKVKETILEDGSIRTEFVGNALVTLDTPVFEDSSSTRWDSNGKVQYRLRICYYRYFGGTYDRYNVTSIQGTLLSIGTNVNVTKIKLQYDYLGKCFSSTGTAYGSKHEYSSYESTTNLGININHLIQMPTTYYYEVTGVDHVSNRCTVYITNTSTKSSYTDYVDVGFGSWVSW